MKIDEIPVINANDLKSFNAGLILVTGHDIEFENVLKQTTALNINSDNVIKDKTVCVPFFTLEKYKKLRHSKLSIFAVNCWGGHCYNRFGLPFLSPTINMFTTTSGFLEFLKNPMQYISEEPRYIRHEWEPNMKIYYPVLAVGNIELHMNHYPNTEEAIKTWQRRRARINWFNILVEMFTEDHGILQEFDNLPYAKKVCFVPFKTDVDSGYYLDKQKYSDPLWLLTNNIAEGKIFEYDIWDMLLYGKKTPLIKQ